VRLGFITSSSFVLSTYHHVAATYSASQVSR
jgi:hypothetical protein